MDGLRAQGHALLLARDELAELTGTAQPAAMAKWLAQRQWVFEPAARRGDYPKVARAYFGARMTGQPLPHQSHQRDGPRLAFLRPA